MLAEGLHWPTGPFSAVQIRGSELHANHFKFPSSCCKITKALLKSCREISQFFIFCFIFPQGDSLITECFYNTRDRNWVTTVSDKKSRDCYLTVLIIQLEIIRDRKCNDISYKALILHKSLN